MEQCLHVGNVATARRVAIRHGLGRLRRGGGGEKGIRVQCGVKRGRLRSQCGV